MSRFREAIEAHPLPWFLGAIVGAFLAGVGAFRAVVSWSGQKIVRDEAAMKFAVRVEPSPTDATIGVGQDPAKFYQGMPLPDGPNEFLVSREGYRPQTVRIARNGATLILSVPLVRIAPLAATDSVQYTGERLSLNFQDVDVHALLQVIGDFTSKNVIVSKSVKGTVSLKLRDVPWDQALDLIAQQAGLDIKRTGNVIFVDVP
ncbi:MAG TPA: secretin and TonB N-terminal domain-containing protein [Opitutaceae bacterium]|nr:secretin and TonB N-terminal domain-containing protein [Opitutaceae bacterium]